MSGQNGTPQLHLIGEIKGAQGFDGNRVFCKYSIRSGHNWILISGKNQGETYEEVKDETEQMTQWDHPFDLHYKSKAIRGWPKFFVEVWSADSEGRYSIGGYGIGIIPFQAGHHKIKINCWRPKPQGFFKQMASYFLGV